jgi:RimJ/RimL family protein N-acetyltransferase
MESVTEWITSAASNRESFLRQFVEPERLARTLVIERDGVVIGDLMLLIQNGWAQTEIAAQARAVEAELGWCLDPRYAGHGYATEAVAELIRICFQELRLHRVTANCFADNTASWRLMERVHMRREIHAIQNSLHRSGKWLDGYGYALLADEWESLGAPAQA